MSSTRKQTAKEKRSGQSDVMSDSHNGDIKLGSYSKNELKNYHEESDIIIDSVSKRLQQNSNFVGEDFRSLHNKISRENCAMNIERTG